MALDPVYITRAIEAAPFPSAPNVVVSYPHREDWWNRYRALRRADGRKRNIDEFEWLYQDSKRAYQTSVLKRLRQIQHWATGRAVFAELRARPPYSVCIFPFKFLPKARTFLTDLRHAQPSLFLALARVDAPFNPIRPVADQLLRIDL